MFIYKKIFKNIYYLKFSNLTEDEFDEYIRLFDLLFEQKKKIFFII